MNNKAKQLALSLPVALTLVACADDGFNEDEKWTSSVQNSQLGNPTIESITKSSTSETEKTVVFTWKVVHGAGGYLLSINNISDPNHPWAVVTDSLIDRCSAAMILPNEQNYEIQLRSASNKKYRNTGSDKPVVAKFDTYVPSVGIPVEAEIATWMAENLEDMDVEQGFALTPGATYHLDTIVDFRLNTVEFRGDKLNPPTIVVGEFGAFMTQGGLKIRDVNIDCSNMAKETGLLLLSDNPDSRLSTETLGYKAQGANQDGFVIQKTVSFQNCKVKNLPKSLLYGKGKNWTLLDFRVQDCIIQSKSETNTKPIINLTDASNGLIQKLFIVNSTFYNSQRNAGENYFLRFSNSSNAQPRKVLGTSNNFLEWTIEHSSFLRTNPKKDFANNIPNAQNGNALWIKMTDCVFFDVYRIYQIMASQWIKTTENNYVSYSDFCSDTATDHDPSGRTDQNGNFYTTLDETPEFEDEQFKELDFSLPNGGLQLAPKGLGGTAQSGDPRWY